jgi:hypothetical protein
MGQPPLTKKQKIPPALRAGKVFIKILLYNPVKAGMKR